MALQNSAQSINAGAFTTPVPITPTASETFSSACFGTQGMRMRVITTGTATNVQVADPGFSPSSNPGTAPSLPAPATGARELLVPFSAINPATGVATVTFSGALTGVTYEIYRA